MTCVSGHLTATEFGPEVKDWNHPPPERLFDAPVHIRVDQVCLLFLPATEIPSHNSS